MTTTTITCPRCAHSYQRTYPKPIICPACGMYLHGCYNREDVSREAKVWVQDGWSTNACNINGAWSEKFEIQVPNAFRHQTCQIDLPACGDCRWRKQEGVKQDD